MPSTIRVRLRGRRRARWSWDERLIEGASAAATALVAGVQLLFGYRFLIPGAGTNDARHSLKANDRELKSTVN
jgi:hypothetical protein